MTNYTIYFDATIGIYVEARNVDDAEAKAIMILDSLNFGAMIPKGVGYVDEGVIIGRRVEDGEAVFN